MKAKHFVIFTLVMLLFVGCASLKSLSTEEKIVAAYVTAGESMSAIHSTWKVLREEGKANDEQNTKFNELFNKAKEIYRVMGNTEILILTAVTKTEKDGYIIQFNEIAAKLPEILQDINSLISLVKGGK